MHRQMDGLYETGPPRDVAPGPLGGNPKRLQKAHERVSLNSWRRVGLQNVRRTCRDGFGPQLVVLELIQISLHEATGLDGLERH